MRDPECESLTSLPALIGAPRASEVDGEIDWFFKRFARSQRFRPVCHPPMHSADKGQLSGEHRAVQFRSQAAPQRAARRP